MGASWGYLARRLCGLRDRSRRSTYLMIALASLIERIVHPVENIVPIRTVG